MTVTGSIQTDYLGISLTIIIILGILFIVWSKVTGQTVGELLSEIRDFIKGN